MKSSKLDPRALFLPILAALVLLAVPYAGATEPAAAMTSACVPPPASLQGGQLFGELDVGPQEKIENGPCSFCTDNSSCSTACYDGSVLTDCGDYGLCDACREGLVEVGRTQRGQYGDEKFWGYCVFKYYYDVTYQSVNGSHCPTYTYCEKEESSTYYFPDAFCCDEIPGGCWGNRC